MPFESPRIVPGQALYFVGDSNSLCFNYLCTEIPEYFAQPIVARACYVPDLSSSTFAPDGELNDEIITFFRREVVLQRSDGWKRYSKVRGSMVQVTMTRSLLPPIHDEANYDNVLGIAIMVGSIDLGHLLRKIGTEIDFLSNDPRFLEASFPEPKLPTIPAKAIVEMIAATLAPLGAGLASLRRMGFETVYLHSLHPPTLDDARYFRVRDTVSSARMRYKITILMNRELERIAAANGARFLDMWDATTIDGKLDPAVALDGDHLNRLAAFRSFEAILRDVARQRGLPLDDEHRTYF